VSEAGEPRSAAAGARVERSGASAEPVSGETSLDDLIRGVARAPRRGSALGPEVPERIGPYRVLGRLGRGGMGVVFRGEHVETGAPAAVKTVRVPRQGLLESIRREIHALARIRHPGVVRILDEGVQDGLPWYAMELVEGGPLRRHGGTAAAGLEACAAVEPEARTRVDSEAPTEVDPEAPTERWWTLSLAGASSVGRPGEGAGPPEIAAARDDEPWKRLLPVVWRLCGPLAFLHGEGIVHRDLKPENVLVRDDGQPVLVDFGLVSHSGADMSREALQAVGQVVGTVAYMAPEQIRGELVDARADLYALGCILYELITGRGPFVGSLPVQILAQHLAAEPLPPSRLASGVPQELDDLVLRLLAKRQQDRLGYADDVAAVLASLGAGEGLTRAEPRPRAYLYRPALAGRGEALLTLERHLDALEGGSGGVVLIGGESGVGKTRLAMEAARMAAQRKLVVLGGECLDVGARPLEGLRKPLQAVADRCREHGRAETERILGARGKLLARYEPALSGLPGQDSHPEPAELSSAAAQLRLFAYLSDTFTALSSQGPLVLLIDDLQWADDLTLGFLEFARRVVQLRQSPLLLIGTYRSEEAGEELTKLLAAPGVESLLLGRLQEQALSEIVRDMLALEAPPRLFVRFLAQQSEGNPFFVAEYLRTAVAEGLLYRDQFGRWQAAEPGERVATEADYARLGLPRSLQQLVARRLDSVTFEARQLVEIASVLGRDVPQALLQAVSRMDEAPLMEAVEDLLARQVLEALESDRLRFVHDKIREVAYDLIPAVARRALHRAAAETIEVRFAEELDDHLAALARHWEQAGEREQARPYHLLAARQARDRFAWREAETQYRAYLSLAPEPSLDTAQVRIELGEEVFFAQGELLRAIEEQKVALQEARALQSPELQGQALGSMGKLYRFIGQGDLAHAILLEALAIHRKAGDRRREGEVLGNLAAMHHVQGRIEEASPLYEEAIALLRHAGDPRLLGRVLGNWASLHHGRGRLETARSLYEQAISSHRQAGDRTGEASVLGNLAVLHYDQGHIDEARQMYERSLELHRQVGDRRGEGVVLGNLAGLYDEQGQFEEARQLYERSLELHRQVGDRRSEGRGLTNLANLELEQGRHDDALRMYREALAIEREVEDRAFEGVVLANLATLHRDEGRVEEAHETYELALAIFRQLGDEEGEGTALRFQAALERRAFGRHDSAWTLASEANSLLRPTGYRRSLALCLCEQGHAALARGQSGRAWLEEAEPIARDLAVLPSSTLAKGIARLQRAQQAFQAGQPLFRGELVEDLPAGLHRWLIETGQLDPSSGEPGERRERT
jgi:serine/threonine protein kinase/tetratricopeptide (TPR) repeat protein